MKTNHHAMYFDFIETYFQNLSYNIKMITFAIASNQKIIAFKT